MRNAIPRNYLNWHDSQNVPHGVGLALPFLQFFRFPSEPEVCGNWPTSCFWVFMGVYGPKQSRSAQISKQKQKTENKRKRMRLLYVSSNFWPNKLSQARIGKFVTGRTQRVISPTLVPPVRVRSYPCCNNLASLMCVCGYSSLFAPSSSIRMGYWPSVRSRWLNIAQVLCLGP